MICLEFNWIKTKILSCANILLCEKMSNLASNVFYHRGSKWYQKIKSENWLVLRKGAWFVVDNCFGKIK